MKLLLIVLTVCLAFVALEFLLIATADNFQEAVLDQIPIVLLGSYLLYTLGREDRS